MMLQLFLKNGWKNRFQISEVLTIFIIFESSVIEFCFSVRKAMFINSLLNYVKIDIKSLFFYLSMSIYVIFNLVL